MALDPQIQALADGTAPAAQAAAPDMSGLDPQLQQLAASVPQTAAPAVPSSPKAKYGLKDYTLGEPEALLSLGSGAAGQVVGGLAGLADAPMKWLGMSGVEPADVVRKVQGALTYEPRTQGGRDLLSAISYLPGKFAQAAEDAGDVANRGTMAATGSPEAAGVAGSAVDTGIQALPMLLGAKLPLKAPAVAAAPAVDPAIAAGANMGLRFAPSEVNPGFNAGNVVESLSGSAKLLRSNAKANAPQVDAAVSRQVGIPEGVAPSKAALTEAKKAPNAVYARAAQTGTVGLPTEITDAGATTSLDPGVARVIQEARSQLRLQPNDLTSMDAGELIDTSRQLRASGFANLRAQRYNPALKALGDTQLEASRQLESALDDHVKQVSTDPDSGVPADLVDQLKDARTTLAQISSAGRALRPGGHFFAGSFAKQLDSGVPLTGDMRTLGELYGRFGRSLQDVNKIKDGGPFGMLDLMSGAGGLEMGHLAGANPFLVPAAIAARPLARAALGSKLYQSRLLTPSAPNLPVRPFLRGASLGSQVTATGQAGQIAPWLAAAAGY